MPVGSGSVDLEVVTDGSDWSVGVAEITATVKIKDIITDVYGDEGVEEVHMKKRRKKKDYLHIDWRCPPATGTEDHCDVSGSKNVDRVCWIRLHW